MEILVGVLLLMAILGITAYGTRRRKEKPEPEIEFQMKRNNSGKLLYRAVVNGKVWTSSDKGKLQDLISRSM